jgi:N-acetylated-alpha-linked acidic dipeptidase
MRLKIFTIVLALYLNLQPLQAQNISGFDRSAVGSQRALEKQFDSFINKNDLRDWMRRLSARPHHVGSPGGKENADFLASLFKSWGFETEIERFDVLFPTPTTRLVEMTAPSIYTAKLEEPALAEDSTSGQKSEQLPIYNVYSINGDVTAPLVYVNYGVPDDYKELEARGIDVRGKIVIARYGGGWRGTKPKVAAEHGAIGCLIYSDPKDDGYYQGDSYPLGAWRHESGAQRGSVADMPIFPGDPLTPGIGSIPGSKRLPLAEATTLTKIPVLAISYSDAVPLLKALTGAVAPESWRGALPITYHLGPGPATVHLKLEFAFNTVPAYNVIARLPGRERPDEWVIRGNHHDAWVNGAADPIGGLVALLAEAKAVGELARTGWRPRRTMIFAAWDGEEPGLLGSTEWVEAHAEELQRKAVLYVNTDNNGRGFLEAGGSHTLEPFMNEIARDVIDPEKRVPVADRQRAAMILQGTPEEAREARERFDVRISALGSGSDYTPFLQHLGIPTLSVSYSGEEEYVGVYHSIYDSFDHFTKFVDPNFDYGVALAQTTGRAILRYADADYLPFNFSSLSETIGRYITQVARLADDERAAIQEKNRRIRDKTFDLVSDPTKPFVAPKAEAPAPFLNFAPLQNAATRFRDSVQKFETAIQDAATRGALKSLDKQKKLDVELAKVEQMLASGPGLPGRPWFKHQIYAPGLYTGYGVKTLPAVREAIEQHRWTEAGEQINVVAAALERAAAQIDASTTALK